MKTLKLLGLVVGGLLIVAVLGMTWMASRLAPTLPLGTPAPDVALATLDGVPLSLAELRGQVVLLDFWSST